MIYEIEVRHQQGAGDYFQPYIETVEALTSHDAVARVQRANPGCNVRCCASYNKSGESSSSSDSDIGDIGGYLVLGAILFGIWVLVEYWWIVVPIAGVSFIIWLYAKFSDH